MELFLLFLVICFGVGMSRGPLRLGQQVWFVLTLVLVMTVLYFVNPGLL